MTTRADALPGEAVPARAGRPLGGVREVAVLAYPAVLQTMSDTALHVVDTAIVGQLGTAQLGGVGFGGLWLWTVLVFFFGSASGVQTFVSQALGAGEGRSKGAWIWQSAYVLVPAATLWLLCIAWGFEAFLGVLGPAPSLVDPALAYTHWRLPGGPAVIGSMILVSFFRGLGDTRTPLMAALVANGLNAALSYGLVLGELGLPAWGAAGAGVATSIANWVALALLSWAVFRRRIVAAHGTWPPRRPRWSSMWRYLRTSLPIGGQWVLDMSSFAFFSTLIARMGAEAAAANQAMIQILSLSFMQAVGLSIATGALVGRYVGARAPEEVERSHRSAQILALGVATVVAALLIGIPDRLLGVFTSAPEVLALGRPLLALGALFQLVDAVGIVAGGALRGAGDTRWPFLIQTLAAWFLRLPLAYLIAVHLEGGILGAWQAELIYVATLAVIFVGRFRAGVWKRMRI